MTEDFGKTIATAYAAEGPTVDLGRGVNEGELVPKRPSRSRCGC